MNKYDKLYQKYAGMLPPPSEELVDISVPKASKTPFIKELTEEEMKNWEDVISEKKLKKDLDITKEIVDLGKEEKAEQEEGTIPAIPGKKGNLSSNELLKMCSQFYDLCRKL